MKIIFISVLFIIIQLAAAATNSAEKCGSLGVMPTDNLPEGVNPAEVRTCADHPFGHKRLGVQSFGPMSDADLAVAAANANMVQPDACYFNEPYGCSGGYCWSSCPPRGAGRWCWLASNNGYGPWVQCATSDHCEPQGREAVASRYSCGQNCKAGSKACGCSCDH